MPNQSTHHCMRLPLHGSNGMVLGSTELHNHNVMKYIHSKYLQLTNEQLRNKGHLDSNDAASAPTALQTLNVYSKNLKRTDLPKSFQVENIFKTNYSYTAAG